MNIQRISCQDANTTLEGQNWQLVDIRDPASYAQGHIPGSQLLNDQNLDDFLLNADPDMTTLVICYHGNSSQNAAAFLMGRDFSDVFSIDGGFQQWAALFPDKIERETP